MNLLSKKKDRSLIEGLMVPHYAHRNLKNLFNLHKPPYWHCNGHEIFSGKSGYVVALSL